MSDQKGKQKKQPPKNQPLDKEGLRQGADAADPASLKKEIDYDGQKPNQQKKPR